MITTFPNQKECLEIINNLNLFHISLEVIGFAPFYSLVGTCFIIFKGADHRNFADKLKNSFYLFKVRRP